MEEMWADFRSHLDKSKEPVLATTPKNPYICMCGGMKIPANDDGLPTCTSCGLVVQVLGEDCCSLGLFTRTELSYIRTRR